MFKGGFDSQGFLSMHSRSRVCQFTLGLVVAALFTGMAAAQENAPSAPAAGVPAQSTGAQSVAQSQSSSAHGSLSGSTIYIYSFLDVRDQEFSVPLLEEIDRQLSVALKSADVDSKLLRFKDSTVGFGFTQSKNIPIYGRYSSSELIPVEQTLASNQDDERSVGAKYRLIEFPANFEVSGAWRFYSIRWILIDCANGKSVLDYIYKGRNMIWLINGERAGSRAKSIVDGVVSAMRAKGYL